MAKYNPPPDMTLCIHVPDRKRPIKIAAWKYYEIICLLREHGVDMQAAYDAAKWAGRTREINATYTQIPQYILKII